MNPRQACPRPVEFAEILKRVEAGDLSAAKADSPLGADGFRTRSHQQNACRVASASLVPDYVRDDLAKSLWKISRGADAYRSFEMGGQLVPSEDEDLDLIKAGRLMHQILRSPGDGSRRVTRDAAAAEAARSFNLRHPDRIVSKMAVKTWYNFNESTLSHVPWKSKTVVA